MGIYIYLTISKSVTKEEWENVYEETLEAVNILPLAERMRVSIRGIPTICLVKTKEQKTTYGWNDENTTIGWNTNGDYNTMREAEDYYLARNLVKENEIKPEAGDAMLNIIPEYLNYDWKEARFSNVYHLWGNKTQGEPYHMYLLMIACLIEERLGEKAFVSGDITRGQCQQAVEIINQYIEHPIRIPARCDMERLFQRIEKLSLCEEERLELFVGVYLGEKDKYFGQFINKMFSEEVCDEYWRKIFKDNEIETYGFTNRLKQYLSWGFDLEKLCSFIDFGNEDETMQCKNFIECIMDTKIHIKNKNCIDRLHIDQERTTPYGVETLFMQFMFRGARNKKVDRYIPIEEVKDALCNGLQGKCDVITVINEYLKRESEQQKIHIEKENMTDEQWKSDCEQDASEVFNQVMDIKEKQLQEENKKYDVIHYEDLIGYEHGDTISQNLKKSLMEFYIFYHSALEEERYLELMKDSAHRRCEWLVEQNRYLLLRDKDWEKIFIDIEENIESFSRYYPMVRVQLKTQNHIHTVRGIVLNDDLYELCKQEKSLYE